MDVPQATADLKSSDPALRAKAAEELAHLEDAAQPTAVALVVATADEDESVRQWATAALESLGPPSVQDAAALAKLLSDARLDVAYWAATLLGRLGPDAGDAKNVAALVCALDGHPGQAVRERAAWALGQVGPAAAGALPALQSATSDAQPRLSRLAKQSIEQISVK
ncbi:MAG TPA: HEAT repeat domain-containing protein [Pirellulales bacterium]|jgi:HEAT repeat protein